MSYWNLLGAALALYVLLNFIILPRITRAWKSNRSLAKISKAGLLAGIEFARDTTLIACIMYIAFALITLALGFTFGGNAGMLGWVVARASDMHAWLSALKKIWETWFFLIPAALIVYVCWRRQRDEFAGKFERLVDDEFDRLNAEREQRPRAWGTVEPDEAMRAVDTEIASAEAELAALPPNGGSTVRENRQKLLRRIVQLNERRSKLDYERRVRLDALNGAVEDERNAPAWRRFILSRGFFSDLKGFSKILSRATLALLSVAMIGAASKAGLTDVVWNRVVRLDDLRVEATKKIVEEEWRKAGRPAGESQLSEDDKRAIAHLADQFARALAQNHAWQPFSGAERNNINLERDFTRREILRKVRLPQADNRQTAPFAEEGTGYSRADREILEDLAPRGWTPESRVGKYVAEHEGTHIKSWFGAKWAGVKSSILKHAGEYHEPVRFKDLQSALIDRIVSAAFDGFVPDPADSEIAKQARSAMSAATKKAVNEAVATELHRVMVDLEQGKPFAETIERVKTADITIGKGQAGEIAGLMRDPQMPNPDELAQKMASAPGSWRSPDDDAHSGGGSGGGGGGGFNGGGRPGRGGGGSGAYSPPDIVDVVAREATQGGKYSLPEEAVDGLAEYEDHFPRSVHTQEGTRLGKVLARYRVASDAQLFARFAELKVARAGSFSMLRGFSRVGGVLIGEDAPVKGRVDIRDISWTMHGRAVTIALTDGSGVVRRFGPFDKSLVHQALGYAADGRPVAVTMTKARPLPQLKIHLHPALRDTPLGYRVTELDRFVDTYAGSQLPRRQEITREYIEQLSLYQFAWAVRLKALVAEFGEKATGRLGERAERIESGTRSMATTALGKPGLLDGERSVFRRKPEFFDLVLTKAVARCLRPDLASFENCLSSEFASNSTLKSHKVEALRRWVEGPATFEPWSGVRERKYTVTSDLSFLTPPSDDSVESRLWPFDFIVQIAFTSAAVSLPEKQQEGYVDQNPIEFDELKPDIARLVARGIASQGLRPMFEDLRSFTVLQRLFRSALNGKLGDRFPLEKLGALTADSGGDIPYFHTRRWNGSVTAQFENALSSAVASGASAGWLGVAAQRGRACLSLLSRYPASQPIPAPYWTTCNFEDVRGVAAKACPDNSRGAQSVACTWARIASMSSSIAQYRTIESQFGVLEDERLSAGMRAAPPLAPAPTSAAVVSVR